jgi:hypothetical protein
VVLGVETGDKLKSDDQENDNKPRIRREQSAKHHRRKNKEQKEKTRMKYDGNELPNGRYVEKTSELWLWFRKS